MLDIECFTYLNRALESPLSPHVILATNRGLCTIRGTDVNGPGIQAPHGVPVDLLDRCMIVRTMPLGRDEMREVLAIRASVEGLSVGPAALDRLADEGEKSSMRCVSDRETFTMFPSAQPD
jgi:RuvB-like protein 1 (pontin 52)